MRNISVFQIYFDDKTRQRLEEEFIPYHNNRKDGYFENSVIEEICQSDKIADSEYIGVSSWKQRSKTQLTGAEILSHIENDIAQGKQKDVYLYPPVSSIKKVGGIVPMEYICNATITSLSLWDEHKKRGQPHKDGVLLNNAGILPFNIFDGKWVHSQCNYWIARKEVILEYCQKVLSPALKFLDREDVKAQMPQWYTHSHEGKKYNSASFILEALFGSFLAHTNYSYSYICKKNFRGKYKKVNIISLQS